MSDKKIYGSKGISIICGLCIGVMLKLFAVDILYVSGDSMSPTIRHGDIIFVNKLAYGLVRPFGADLIASWSSPSPGDIVIYIYNSSAVVKRCIATEGMPLDFSADSGYSLHIGGHTIPLDQEQYHKLHTASVVPDNMIFAVGDNYSASVDSRTYGFIAENNILGKVLWK
ncbi:MAG TPA: signal peptidase I [Candidatus Treponema faecavium]|nr:signal peptidase I [Candidatus Treponema faecavium]